MTMTQRYAGMLRRHAAEWDKRDMPVQAECARQAARHMEELQAKVDAITSPWQPIKTAPKDGTAILVLLPSLYDDGLPALLWADDGVQIGWWDGEDWVNLKSELLDPTHWQPLPPPPQEAP
jgi:hypothetical protein